MDHDSWSALPHVLLVVDGFPKALGGGERVLLRLAELLPRFGYRVSILTFRIDPDSSVLKRELPCPLYVLTLERTHDLRSLGSARAFGRFLRGENIRLVMTFFESSDLWAGTYTRLLSRAKLVWNRRDLGILRGRKHRAAYRLLARAPHRVFCVSERVHRYTVAVDHVAASRVETIYNGLDLRRFLPVARPVKSAQEGWHIVAVGNLRRVKGHDLLLRAAAQVLAAFPETRFSIAGAVLEPEFAAELETLARELGIADRVSFAGAISDLPAYLAGADLFVLPSRSEGFSNAILEAMASGLPVVATDVGGNAEAVQEGITGLVVPAENVAALGEAIVSLLADTGRARSLGDRGRARVIDTFSEEAVLRQMAEAFRELLELP